MKIRLLFTVLLQYIVVSEQVSTPADDHYWVGIVEFSSKDKWTQAEAPDIYAAKTLEKYLGFINSPEAETVDIFVFPESTTTVISTASFVPAPADGISPCNSLEFEPFVRELACAARNRKKYVVVNLVEKALCPEDGDRRPCAPNGLYHFNTNVVFDRNGFVVARYRKYNLFGEAGFNVTAEPEIAQFDTDFGVTFGTFICFDLMFEQPALELVRRGITDIIFPSMWFSELPFLTAVQIQQAWAYANNVNLISAGASYPEVGSTGSGVYAGRRGRIVSVMNHHPEEKLYVAQVPKIDRPEASITRFPSQKHSPLEMNNLLLKRDQIDSYVSAVLPLVNNDNYQTRLCQNLLCCNFTINYTVTLPPSSSQQFYRYRLVVSDGWRTFDGVADGLITACGVLACTGDGLESCAVRFANPATAVEAVRFNSLTVEGIFPGGEDVFLVPNSVDTGILPLEVAEIEYSERQFTENNEPQKHIHYKLVSSRSDLYTFAIWGRKFFLKSGASIPSSSALVSLAVVLCASLVKRFTLTGY